LADPKNLINQYFKDLKKQNLTNLIGKTQDHKDRVCNGKIKLAPQRDIEVLSTDSDEDFGLGLLFE